MFAPCEIVECRSSATNQLKLQNKDLGDQRARMTLCEFHKEVICGWRSLYRELERRGDNLGEAIAARDQILLYIDNRCKWRHKFQSIRNYNASLMSFWNLYPSTTYFCDYQKCNLVATVRMPSWKDKSLDKDRPRFCFFHAHSMTELYFRYKFFEDNFQIDSFSMTFNATNAYDEALALATVIADRTKFNLRLKSNRNRNGHQMLIDYLILLYSARVKTLLFHGEKVPICCDVCKVKMRQE
jgi:hypothetical protein